MRQIGKYRVIHEGGRWQIVYLGEIVGEYPIKWDAIREARRLNWEEADYYRKRAAGHEHETGGSEEPKSKWRRPYNGGTHG